MKRSEPLSVAGIFVLGILVMGIRAAFAAGELAPPWSAEPDPASGAAPTYGKIRLNIPVAFPYGVEFAWPVQPGPLVPVAITPPPKDYQWSILDLRSGKIVPAANSGELEHAIASADGKYVAGTGSDAGYACQVWSLSEKKRLVSLKADQGTVPAPVAFRGEKDVFISHVSLMQKEAITETDLPSGKTLRTYTLAMTITPEGSAISPGGKYLAALSQVPGAQHLCIADLSAGKLVGVSSVPLSKYHSANAGFPAGAAFSDDGKTVAVLFKAVPDYRIIEWDFATGKIQQDLSGIKVDLDLGSNEQGPMFQIAPGGESYRISHFLYDRKTGKPTATIPLPAGQTGHFSIVQMIAPDRALVASEPTMMNKSAKIETIRVGD